VSVHAASKAAGGGAASLREFEALFRKAVLAKDVEWILARMDPAGWQCGDAEMLASAYAETFRRGEMDYRTLFDLELTRRKGIVPPTQLSYQEWFKKCPAAEAVEEEVRSGQGGTEYAIRWRGPGCPEDGPAMGIVQGPKGIWIQVFGGCM
jgi:hypothetical protein